MQLSSGTLLQGGKYKIERVLGQGGFGITYLATQVELNRRVAIKEFFMREYCNRDATTSHVTIGSQGSREVVEKFRSKFVKEAQNIACLKHPHIISIYDVFKENDTAYYVMEYLDHGSLAQLVKLRGRLSEADALRYTRQIADALRYIHARNMNHLDVKPGNILIDETDGAVLIDFGLSKRYDDEGNQTSTTPVGISHGYAPLEQYKKGGVGTFSPATDIYSLGATLYKLITGDTPPDANDVNDEGLSAFPSYVSPSVVSAIEQAMQPRRKDRPQSVEEFLALLDAPSSDIPVTVEDEATLLDDYPLRPSGSLSGTPSHRALCSPHSARLGIQPTLQGPRYAPLKRGNANIAEEDVANKQIKKNCPSETGGRAERNSVEQSGGGMTSPDTASSSTLKKLLWLIVACVVVVVAFFGVRAYNNMSAENSRLIEEVRLAAIEQRRVDSIAKENEVARLAEEAARLEHRLDSIAKENEVARLAEEAARLEQHRKDSIAKAKEAEEKRKEEEKLKAEKAKSSRLTGKINGHEYVDLGLSVKWATCNVGASSPSDYGGYYAWGETSIKRNYTEETYKYYKNGECVNIGTDISGTKYDAARVNWGGTWRMPTLSEIKELEKKCSWTLKTLDGVNGYLVTGPSGNSIFLPAAGYCYGGYVRGRGSYGNYWSATLYSGGSGRAYYLFNTYSSYYFSCYGYSVRPVTE